MTGILLRQVRLRDGRLADVHVSGGHVASVADAGSHRTNSALVVDANGGLLLPGLHDHHLHLLATAAAVDSVDCGPHAVRSTVEFSEALRRAATDADGGWVRAVGYHESVAGDLDRDALDRIVCDVPIRVQHRSGALWMVNSEGLRRLGGGDENLPDGVERDACGRPTGRLWRMDSWLHGRVGAGSAPDLERVGTLLTARGLTGVTDATPNIDRNHLRRLLEAVESGKLPQRIHLLGVDELPSDLPPWLRQRVTVGPRKILLADHDLPSLPQLLAQIQRARTSRGSCDRPVAVHCVSRVALVLLCAALEEVGAVHGDRVEHASVVPADLLPRLRRLGVTVVTQPGFVAYRGDEYLREVDADDLGSLYRYATLLQAGVPVVPSSDAPYTAPNPWSVIHAAAHRRTRCGRVLGTRERVAPATALDGFLTPADGPGGSPRRLIPGVRADLTLLEPAVPPLETGGNWEPEVRAVLIGGRLYPTDPASSQEF